MKKFKLTKLLVLFLSVFLFSCSSEDDNYKSYSGSQDARLFNAPSSTLEVLPNGPTFIEVLVSSTVVSNVDRNIEVSINNTSTALPTQYSIDMSTAVIPAGQNTAKLRINSGSYAAVPTTGATTIVLVFNQGIFSLDNRNNHVVSVQRGCIDTKVNLNIAFDGYASEISWNVTNSSNTIIASSGLYSDGLGSYQEQLCLTPGTYSFTMNDSFGDGLSFPSNGSFTLSLDSDNSVLVTGGGNFGSSIGPLSFTIN